MFRKEWTFGSCESGFIELMRPSIEYLELCALTVAVLLWAAKLQNKRVIVFCDNKSVVEMINKSVSSCRNCMAVIRQP